MSNKVANNDNAENTKREANLTENVNPQKSLDAWFQEIMADRQSQYEQDAEQLARMILEVFQKDKYLTCAGVSKGNCFKINNKDTKIGYSDVTRALLVDKLTSIKGLSVSKDYDHPDDLSIYVIGSTRRSKIDTTRYD